jgi:flagellar hook-associated protein 1 FlgK
MSLTVALNTAVSGLFANQTAIAATSENIANVNTANFARREATFRTDAIPDQVSGVSVEIARAAVDRFLQGAFYAGGADAAAATALADALAAIEASLGAPGENLSYANALDDAFAALAALAANPASIAARADALAALDDAFAAFGRTQDAIDNERAGALSRLSADVARANELLADIYRLNAVVPDSPGAGDLIDARLAELSRLLSISVTRNDQGQATVAGADGTILARPGGYVALGAAGAGPIQATLSAVDPASGATSLVNADASALLASGEIAGLARLINAELPALSGRVAAAASAIAAALNAEYAQNSIVGAAGPTSDVLIVAGAGGRLAVNAALIGDPARFAIARPSSGVGGPNDGAGAAALAFVGGGAAARDVSQSVAEIGSAARNARTRADTAGALDGELTARLASAGGVNLDEELSNLILYQRAYGANARVIAAVDELWQTLLNVI